MLPSRLACSALLIALLSSPLRAGEGPGEFRHDFRGGQLPQVVFRFVGRQPAQHIKVVAEGLRIALPAAQQSFPPTGISPKFTVAGDFEITVRYQILKLDKPESGYGSGVSIFVQTLSEGKEAATLGFFIRRSGDLVYAANHHSGQGTKRHHVQSVPASETARSGRLRLTRSGTALRYAVAQGNGEEFTQLREVALGSEPLARLRIAADPGGAKSALEVVLNELVIRADSLTSESEQLARSSSWAFWAIGGGLLVTAGACLLFFWWRRRQAATAVSC
jgi:Protein of unknown function (DUF1583) C domain